MLVEEEGQTVLIDPGNYTLDEHALAVDELEKLDFVLITHEHSDHMSVPLLKQIREKFPDVRIIGNSSVADLLAKEAIPVSTQGTDFIEMVVAPHEDVLAVKPQNTLFHLFGNLTHPGDSLQFAETKEILALPIQAPWGSMVQAVKKAAALKPKLVIPIHDWHWHDQARKGLYGAAANHLRQFDIEFRGLETGESIDIIHS